MKLPGIEYGQVSAAKGLDPSYAAAEYKAKQRVLDAATGLASKAFEVKNKYDQDKADIDVTNKLAEFNQTVGTRTQFTADEARELGITDEKVLKSIVGGQMTDRNDIMAYEVYPAALKIKLDQVIGDNVGTMFRGASRNAWEKRMRINASGVLEKATVNAQKQVEEFDLNRRMLDIAEAEQQGNFVGVHSGIDQLPLDKNQKKELHVEANQKQEINDIRVMSRSNNLEGLQQEYERLGGNDYDGDLTSDQIEQQRSYISSHIKAVEAGAKKQAEAQKKSMLTEFWVGYQDNPNPSDIPAWVEPGERRAMLSYAEQGGNPSTKIETWYKLHNMSVSDPLAFAEMNLMEFRGDISNADFKSFAQIQKASATSTTEQTNLRTFGQQINGSLNILGINPKAKAGTDDAKKTEHINRTIAGEINQQELKLGRKMTADERQPFIDQVTNEYKYNYKWGPDFLNIKAEEQYDYDSIPPDKLDEITKALTGAGMEASFENIMKTYGRMKSQ